MSQFGGLAGAILGQTGQPMPPRPADFASQGGSGLHPNALAGPQDPLTGRTPDPLMAAARAAYPEFDPQTAMMMYTRDRSGAGAASQAAPAAGSGNTFAAVEDLLRQQTGQRSGGQ